MKKILTMLGAFGLTATSVMPVLACNKVDETIKGLKATTFSTKLYGVESEVKLYSIIMFAFFQNALNKEQQKEITKKEEILFFLFGFKFSYKFGENVSFPLKEDDKITITITKMTIDKEIEVNYKKLIREELSAEELVIVKKYQEYVSGSKFSAEITIVKPSNEEQNNH